LSHIAAGNPLDSPLIDAGSGLAIDLGLTTGWTTRVDNLEDGGTVDVGYHYSSFVTPPLPRVVPVMTPFLYGILLVLAALIIFFNLFVLRE
jgi:hypothetical protein